MSEPVASLDCPDLPCKAVTVYSDRAEVKKSVATTVKAGSNEVQVKKFPSTIDKESIRVDGRGKATICEVQYQEKHVIRGEDVQAEQKKFQDQIDMLQKEKEQVVFHQNRLRRQRQIIDGVAGQITKGATQSSKECFPNKLGFTLDEENMDALEKFLEFYGRTTAELDLEIQQMEEKLKETDDQLKVLRKNQAQLGSGDQISREVSIILEASEDGDVELDISYIVSKASWTPSYDLRVFTKDKTMKVHYYGLIKQNTGEDWDDTKLSLSTATPSIGGEIPELKTLKVSAYRPPTFRGMTKSKSADYGRKMKSRLAHFQPREEYMCGTDKEDQVLRAVTVLQSMDEYDEEPKQLNVPDINVRDTGISTSFEIARRGSVPSDNTDHKVNVGIVELEPKFEHEVVASKSPHAYLKAKVVNKSSYPFLPGTVSVFLDNNFLAKSRMKAVSPMEEFSCSLGIDPSVRVEYKPVKKYRGEAGMITRSTVTIHDQRIEIKNTKVEEDVNVKLLEQIPLSEDEKVKIVLLEPVIPKREKEAALMPYKLNKENNLEWDLTVEAGKTQTLQVKYSLDHPKNDVLEFKEE